MSDRRLDFCGLRSNESQYGSATAVILPVPFDKTSTWCKGADQGPKAIIEASRYLEFYDIETDTEILTKGIYTARPIKAASSSALIRKTERAALRFIQDNKLVVTLGGEHSVSIGAISRYNHACVIARVREVVGNIVSVGIRSMDASERPGMDKKRMFFAHTIYDSEEWITRVVRLLGRNVYVTIDLDVFDPGIMPSTGTPEPGGLSWYQVMKLLRAVSKSKRVLGFDVVELCPSHVKAPDFLAAKLIYTFLSYIEANAPRGIS